VNRYSYTTPTWRTTPVPAGLNPRLLPDLLEEQADGDADYVVAASWFGATYLAG